MRPNALSILSMKNEVKHGPAQNGAFLSRALFSVDGQAFEACRFTRADGASLGIEVYQINNGLAELLGYAEALFQHPAAEVAQELLAR